jgi:hypothetical protein
VGVSKVNYHKPTRFAANGFREALCPVCGRWAYVMSYQDDTRWRYMEHRVKVDGGPACEGSRELVAASIVG